MGDLLRVTVWGINYGPEMTGIAPYNQALCEYLAALGVDTEMVTSFQYYPGWTKRMEDAGHIFQSDSIAGVRVRRCWMYVPAKVTALRRILHEASFVAMSSLRVLSARSADVYVVVGPPLLLGAAAWLVTFLKRSAFVFHVQDLQPDAAVSLGMLRPGVLTKMLYFLEAFAYRQAARVSGISRGMLDMFRRKKVPESKLIYFPNGVNLSKQAAAHGMFRGRLNLPDDVFIALYAGNLGIKQGLDILVDVAKALAGSKQDRRIHIVVAGDGAHRDRITRAVTEQRLDNLTLLPLQPLTEYREMLADADVCLITQQAGTGAFFFPSKLLAALGAGKPVVTVADCDSELARAVSEGNLGVNVLPDSAQGLAGALRKMAELSEAELQEFTVAGEAFVRQFEMRKVLEEFTAQLQLVVKERRLASAGSSAGAPARVN